MCVRHDSAGIFEGDLRGFIFLIVLSLAAQLSVATLGEENDYCHLEAFNATCPDGHVILMQNARYGRMKVGRCLTTNYFVGCYADVIHLADTRCSGRQSCLVSGLDTDLVKTQPCRKDLMAYLEASYTCVAVPTTSLNCPSDGYEEVTKSKGFLPITTTGQIGTNSCPWLIHAKPGQRINITLYDFGIWQRRAKQLDSSNDGGGIGGGGYSDFGEDHRPACRAHLRFSEEVEESSVDLCGSDARSRHVFLSSGHFAEVYLDTNNPRIEPSGFLIQHQVVGCADIIIGENYIVKRKGETAAITCNVTKETWHVVCKDGGWLGDIGNCSNALKLHTGSGGSGAYSTKFHYGILIAVALGLVLGVLIGTFMLLSMLALRQRRRRQNMHHKASERDASLLADAADPTYITTQRLVPMSSYTVKVPDYSQTATYAAPAVCGHRACEVVHEQRANQTPGGDSGADDGPDVIYPRRIALPLGGAETDSTGNASTGDARSAFPSLRTFRNCGGGGPGGQYEPPMRTIGGGVNTSSPVYHVFTGGDDEFELHELQKLHNNSSANSAIVNDSNLKPAV